MGPLAVDADLEINEDILSFVVDNRAQPRPFQTEPSGSTAGLHGFRVFGDVRTGDFTAKSMLPGLRISHIHFWEIAASTLRRPSWEIRFS